MYVHRSTLVHLLLRIVDILLRNMITEMVRMDIKSHTLRSGHTNHLTLFEKTVQKCGVSFKIWEKKDGNGKNSGHYDWTSLPGRDKKIY